MYGLNAAREAELWQGLLNKFKYETYALMDIQEKIAKATKRMWQEEWEQHKFALDMGYMGEEEYYSWLEEYRDENFTKWSDEYNAATLELKKYSDKLYNDTYESAKEELNLFEDSFYTWFNHTVEMGEMSMQAQSQILKEFADEYNAMVSDIVASAEFGAEETAKLWEMAYDVRREVDEGVFRVENAQKSSVVSDWEKDKDAWIEIHNTYDDWTKIGDSLVDVYARCIDKQREFFDAGILGWEEYIDGTRNYSLLLYRAVSDEYDELLEKYAQGINTLETQYSKEISELKSGWDNDDREESLQEIRRQIKIYKNAATDAGKSYYESLLEQEKKLEREEELYDLEVEQSETLDKLWENYKVIENEKSKALSAVKNADLASVKNGANILTSTKYISEIASGIYDDSVVLGYSSLDMLGDIYTAVSKIGKKLGSSSVYNNNSTVHISGGVSESYVSRLINGTVVSGLGSVMGY